jgi:hypothetical protein
LDPLPLPPSPHNDKGTGMEGSVFSYMYSKMTKRDFEEAAGHIAASIYREQFL